MEITVLGRENAKISINYNALTPIAIDRQDSAMHLDDLLLF